MKTLFIDEAGMFVNNIKRLDPDNPVFLICGIVISKSEENKLSREFKKLKKQLFGTDDFLFHSLEFTHPSKSKQPEILQFTNASFRANFYPRLTRIISKIDFRISGFVVHTEEYLRSLKKNAPDPYELGVGVLLEQLTNELSGNEQAKIIAESRSSQNLNQAVISRWKNESNKHGRVGITENEKLKRHGIQEPQFLDKNPNHSGLELVDLIAYQFARGIIQKPKKGIENEIPIELIESKIGKYYSLPTHPMHYLNKNKS